MLCILARLPCIRIRKGKEKEKERKRTNKLKKYNYLLKRCTNHKMTEIKIKIIKMRKRLLRKGKHYR